MNRPHGHTLLHGTSTLHTAAFAVGAAPTTSPDGAIDLLRAAWSALERHGERPERWLADVLRQASGRLNWRHGAVVPQFKFVPFGRTRS